MRCGKAYLFKGHKYVRWDIASDRREHEAVIADEWTGFAGVVGSAGSFGDGIDAAINWGNGKAYLFKGNTYLRWDILTDTLEHHATIADGWPGLAEVLASTGSFADGIDAAINWGNGKAYLFKGHKYLRWDILSDVREHEAVIADGWTGLADAVSSTGSFGDGIDAAINWAAPFVLRSQWGASTPTSRTAVPIGNRTEFIVHYSTGQELGREDTCAWVKSIQQEHMTNRSWADIGYNFLVDRFGNVFEGRGRDVEGAHTPGHNTSGIGVCFLGNDDPAYEDATPHAKAQIRNLWRRFSDEAGRELARHGHRDFTRTQCPGDELYAWVTGGMPAP